MKKLTSLLLSLVLMVSVRACGASAKTSTKVRIAGLKGPTTMGLVNLLNMENVDRREEVFAEAIELLGKDIAMIHFKDFLRKDAGGQLAATGAGQGGMEDYRTILRFAKQEKPYIFATLENTTPENAVECLNYLKKQYDEC